MICKFNIQKNENAFASHSREVMRDQFGALPDGEYTVTIEPAKEVRNTTSRYKYYFGHLLPAILDKCGKSFRMINPRTGEESTPRNTTDLHECIKMMFNPVTIITPRGAFNTPGTTTSLSNREFISEFTEMIMAYFADAPYFVEFVDRDEWKEMCKAGIR